MKNQNTNNEENESPFSQSVGDLMSALLLVFVLLLIVALVNNQKHIDTIKKKQAEIENIGDTYNETKTKIYNEISSAFADDLQEWEAEIDSVSLSVKFSKATAMFDINQSDIKPEFRKILAEFFPKYLKIIHQNEAIVDEIRIEGHTSNEGEYFHNMKLSQDRARNVLNFCYSLPGMDKKFLEQKVTSNGYSYSRLIMTDGNIDKEKSRRVEFRIITNSEQRIREIMDKIK